MVKPEGWKRDTADQYQNYCKKCARNHDGLRLRGTWNAL